MRIISFLAPSSKQAMADLRAKLGDDAIILSTRTLDDGQICVTGAVSDDVFDLADVLAPTAEPRSLEWLRGLAEFHEWPIKEREKIEAVLRNMAPAGPEIVLTTLVQALFRFDTVQRRTRKPIILSGPPGSGKTVTIAKLAAAEVLAGNAVDIVTLDVQRAGSLDQLSTLLKPLDLSPIAVSRSAELPNIVAACKSGAILVDTVGINPFNPADLGAISSLAVRIAGDLILVLPAGQGQADSADIARSYAAVGARAMVVTKLDVARRFGGVLAAAEAGLAFTQAGIGPMIGNGLCALSADGVARLLLHRYYSSTGEECAG
jgi:flagellar biosynthesis protein FlhF